MPRRTQIKNKLTNSFLACMAIFICSCEKDDICNEGTPGTPSLVIRFYDHQNPTQYKNLPEIKIQHINRDYPLYLGSSSDSIALPMDLTNKNTRYAFILASTTDTVTVADTLQFNHANRVDEYARRACGFKASYQLSDPPVIVTNTGSWFIRAEILIDTLRNEEQAHLAIYH